MRGLSDFTSEDGDAEIRSCIRKHFTLIQSLVKRLVKEIRPEDYEALVPVFLTLISGSMVVAQATGNAKIAAVNKNLAATLL